MAMANPFRKGMCSGKQVRGCTPYTEMCKVGQDHIYTVYIRYFWQGNHQLYGLVRCIYTIYGSGQP